MDGDKYYDWQADDKKYFINTYNRYPIMLVRGMGTKVWDGEGREYLDFLSGIGVSSLGHAHPRIAAAAAKQAATLIHTSNLYGTAPALELARRLTAAAGMDKALFCNSGAEAVEGALKMARKYHYRRGDAHRHKIVSVAGSFHGRTYGSLAATAQPALHEGFGPMPGGFEYVPRDDVEALDAALGDDTAAFIIEPVQGEGGIYPVDGHYLQEARRLTAERGILLIFDEIQCGMGRTGSMFAWQQYGVKPDILVSAKGLGGGFPIGAVLADAEAASGFAPGDHGTTFGGNPVACSAALAVLDAIETDGLLEHAAAMGARLADRLREAFGSNPGVKEIRGMGLMMGIVMNDGEPAPAMLEHCHRLGLLANVTAGTVLRLLPPLTVSAEEIDKAAAILMEAAAAAGIGAAR